ncbi:MAG: hypothetical protein KDN18_16215 [Verrucomicrobiae bacterium]|nr:hypothetical protein [Verrucomicrobiae bacterium]
MKALRLLALIVLLLLAGARIAWQATRPEIPLTRTWISEDGKSLEAEAVGRTGQILHLERSSDHQRFELPFSRLSWKDRFIAERLPEQAPPPLVAEKDSEPEDPYVANRRKAIADLTRKRAEYIAEIESGSLSSLLSRKRREDVLKVEEEIVELEGAINLYLARKKPD